MIYIQIEKKGHLYFPVVWDKTGYIKKLPPERNEDYAKINAHRVALRRQGDLKVINNIDYEICY